jgi:hypothetical protein
MDDSDDAMYLEVLQEQEEQKRSVPVARPILPSQVELAKVKLMNVAGVLCAEQMQS